MNDVLKKHNMYIEIFKLWTRMNTILVHNETFQIWKWIQAIYLQACQLKKLVNEQAVSTV
ncbi:hypothetical protein M422DRAFT_248001 [Sphaerobolus stellatus SS14]|nr:hypothetical protein M422DRAFT_248001 [Sphaerobolus stellatus SS14]